MWSTWSSRTRTTLPRELYDAEVKAAMIGPAEIEYAAQRAKIDLVLRQIARRFGEAPPGLATRLDRLSPNQLDELGVALLDFATYADVNTWLTAHPW